MEGGIANWTNSNLRDQFKKHPQTENMSDTEFIAARQDRWRAAHNSLDADKLMALMADDCDYSDHGN